EMLIPVIKEKRFQRIGGKADIPLGARIVSATNEDLAHLVSQGGFIPGLYSQLNELYIEVPPLRERKEDIPLLVDHFIRENWNRKKRGPKGISEEAMKRLLQHNWPGNILELKGRIEVGCTFADQELITADHIIGI
ncbi:MAG: two-component system response regulator, partial [Deltaproteobacteria bacterium]|nr:two-component system response regulator [Deltaproteobacteria bacterium]